MSTDLPAIADEASERALLGCMLTWPETRRQVFATVRPLDFYNENHGTLAAVIADMPEVNPQLVLSECSRRGILTKIGGGPYLATLLERATTAQHAVLHATDVLRASRRRELWKVGTRAAEMALRDTVDLHEHAVAIIDAAERAAEGPQKPVDPPVTVEDFLAGDESYDWLIPGLLERRDRLMVTGGEGAGKSTLVQQLAVCAAAGLHPFTQQRVDPVRVLIVDCENGRPHLRRRLRPLLDRANGYERPVLAERLRIISRPEGIDLAAADDRAWLSSRVLACRPDLLTIGPLYRLHGSAVDKEDAARELVGALDSLRSRVGCALLIEAHAPHGQFGQRALRPAGSSLFMRWPEFGYGLKLLKKDRSEAALVAWRGPRDERSWPKHLRAGYVGDFPWVQAQPMGVDWDSEAEAS